MNISNNKSPSVTEGLFAINGYLKIRVLRYCHIPKRLIPCNY
jgi:hypothetical protein